MMLDTWRARGGLHATTDGRFIFAQAEDGTWTVHDRDCHPSTRRGFDTLGEAKKDAAAREITIRQERDRRARQGL